MPLSLPHEGRTDVDQSGNPIPHYYIISVFDQNRTSTFRCSGYPSTTQQRMQGSRPRTQKKFEAKAKDSFSEDRPSRGQGQECSRPRTKDTGGKCSPKSGSKFFLIFLAIPPKKVLKFFSGDRQKKVLKIFFQAFYKILTIQNIVLSSSQGQGNFCGLEASRPRRSKCVLEAKDVLEDFTSATLWLHIAQGLSEQVLFITQQH